ncbi:uncharacterized protein LOC129590051 [Paramacrobiotus metropolitanus]|uniref:uncharacterized protein LOC129590051 n=1 Tax=Paramacrobiotus metropolitanus TaxID=2943436 RepID=UPI0024458DE9|nr:uncharacterized protein LOC129590051 [Paramacrobiotus metropolitanus]
MKQIYCCLFVVLTTRLVLCRTANPTTDILNFDDEPLPLNVTASGARMKGERNTTTNATIKNLFSEAITGYRPAKANTSAEHIPYENHHRPTKPKGGRPDPPPVHSNHTGKHSP